MLSVRHYAVDAAIFADISPPFSFIIAAAFISFRLSRLIRQLSFQLIFMLILRYFHYIIY
jgi:hypothetical protein